MLLGAENTDSICAAIERHCRVLDENCESFCGQAAETQYRGKQRLLAQLLRCHAEHALEVAREVALVRKSNSGGDFGKRAVTSPRRQE